MEGFWNYKKYLQGKVITRKPARVKGRLYHLIKKGYPALVEGNDYVSGELLTIKDYEENIVKLDKLEGYYGLNNPENEYNRVLKDVEIIPTGEKSRPIYTSITVRIEKTWRKKTTISPVEAGENTWNKKEKTS